MRTARHEALSSGRFVNAELGAGVVVGSGCPVVVDTGLDSSLPLVVTSGLHLVVGFSDWEVVEDVS